jgi:endonuclease/exonuclease/phosphatase (EEP) superfamily protein YafD
MGGKVARVAGRYAIAGIWVYYTLLFFWALMHFLTGDRFPVFVILNVVALYLFLPVPLALAAAILTRRRELWLGAGISLLVLVILWGRLFVPRARQPFDSEPTLTVMSYNVRGTSEDVDASIRLIESVDPDVVLLQEVNDKLAGALRGQLGQAYPYQIVDPYNDVRGMGTISELPMIPTGEKLPLEWVGTPQISALEWAGRRVRLVNFHMWAVGLGPMRYIEINAKAKEAHALYLVDFAQNAANEWPVIVAGDTNATPQGDTYRVLRMGLEDS